MVHYAEWKQEQEKDSQRVGGVDPENLEAIRNAWKGADL